LKSSQKSNNTISVITVVYNGQDYLEETIQTVLKQTYQNKEYIIIDGGSLDDTVEIIKKYEDSIDYWISEPDNGIADAMNKGLKVAQGDYILFLHSDDYFLENNTLEKASQ
jgi:glycosyltransferase involved in cell wall biosynthesis